MTQRSEDPRPATRLSLVDFGRQRQRGDLEDVRLMLCHRQSTLPPDTLIGVIADEMA